MSDGIVIIGAGGFGRHVLSILRSQRDWDETCFLGFVDDGDLRKDRLEALNAAYLGTTEVLADLPNATQYVVGIGNGRVRQKLDTLAAKSGLTPKTVIHPDSSIAADCVVGEGSVICAGVRITTNVALGRQVHLNMNVTVGHDVTIEQYSTVYPLVAIGGESRICEGTTLGAGSTINPGITTGLDSFVAAGAVVVNDVAPNALVIGVPAKRKYCTVEILDD